MVMLSGVVEQVETKTVTTKFGEKPTYSIKVAGQWVKCGFKNPAVEVGYTVNFDGVTGRYGMETSKVNIESRGGSVSSGTAVGTSPGVSRPASSSVYSGKVFPIPPLHGDRSIVRQNALARATELYVAAHGNKPFEVDESVCRLIIRTAKVFEGYTAGDDDLDAAVSETSGVEI